MCEPCASQVFRTLLLVLWAVLVPDDYAAVWRFALKTWLSANSKKKMVQSGEGTVTLKKFQPYEMLSDFTQTETTLNYSSDSATAFKPQRVITIDLCVEAKQEDEACRNYVLSHLLTCNCSYSQDA